MPASSTKPIDAALQDDASGYSRIDSTTCTHRWSFRNGDTKPLSALEELTTVTPLLRSRRQVPLGADRKQRMRKTRDPCNKSGRRICGCGKVP